MEDLLELLHLHSSWTSAVPTSRDFLEKPLADISIILNDTLAVEFQLSTLVLHSLCKNHSNVCQVPYL